MASMALASFSPTTLDFAPKGIKVAGPQYLELDLFPSMKFVSAVTGVHQYCFQQNPATSHSVAPVLLAAGRNVPFKFSLKWPAKSPDLSPRN